MLKAIVFDFDGVLVESVDIKADAFVALYRNESALIQKQVLDYHNKNGGISRFEKIRYYEEVLLNRAVTSKEIAALADEFGVIVEQKVIECPWVKGAHEFLEAHRKKIPFFVASATPQEELLRIIDGRGASHYFTQILGTPLKKHEHISNIMSQYGWSADELLMVGDAMTDYEAARICGTSFIGRVPENSESPFPEGTRLISDLTSLSSVSGL